MAVQPTFSINGAAEALGRDRSVITRVLRNVQPDSKARGKATFYLATVVDALLEDALGAAGEGKRGLELSAERAKLAKVQTEAVQIKNQLASGELCKTATAVAWMIAICVVIRELVLTLPGKMADAVEGQPREKIEELLMDEARAILKELSDPKTFLRGDDKSGIYPATEADVD